MTIEDLKAYQSEYEKKYGFMNEDMDIITQYLSMISYEKNRFRAQDNGPDDVI